MRSTTLLILVVLFTCPTALGAAEHVVDAKDGKVRQNSDIDFDDEEEVEAESNRIEGVNLQITSKAFLPPGSMDFAPFPSGTHVDVETDPGGLPAVRLIDTSKRIKVAALELPLSPGDFPLKAEGNLKPPGSGGEEELPHWSVKMPDCQVVYAEFHYNLGGPIDVPNDHPDAPVGVKYHPGAEAPGGDYRALVEVVVRVQPARPAIRVYCEIFDPDDPSSDGDEDAIGGDNLGEVTPRVFDGLTDSFGEFRRSVVVSVYPGDNHRIAATCKAEELDKLDDQVVGPNDDQVDGFAGRVSRLLTIFRKLHLELDSMPREPIDPAKAKPDKTRVILKDVQQGVPEAGKSTVVTGGAQLPEAHFYEGGDILGRKVLQNTANVIFDDEFIVEGEIPQHLEDGNLKKLIQVLDDDPVFTLPHDLTVSDFTKRAFKYAYIDAVQLDAAYDPTHLSKWVNNLTAIQANAGTKWDDSRDAVSTAPFWTHLVVACYQGPTAGDGDPDFHPLSNTLPGDQQIGDSAFITGFTPGSNKLGFGPDRTRSAIFMATLLEKGFGGFPLLDTDIPHTVTHEIGHAVEEGHPEGGIMEEGAPSSADRFLPATINLLRDQRVWGER